MSGKFVVMELLSYTQHRQKQNEQNGLFNGLAIFQFNDPNAKIMHMKGRKHRQQYKKKVDPELKVDVKPSNRQKQLSKLSGPYANDLLEGDMNGGRFVCTQFIFSLLFVKEINLILL